MPVRSSTGEVLAGRIDELEARIASAQPLGPSRDIPMALFVYRPEEELELRRQVDLLATRLTNLERPATVVDLGEILWECLSEHPLGPDGIIEAEKMSLELGPVIQEGHILLAGTQTNEPGPLEQKLIERLSMLDRERDVALLVRAGELYPMYRTSALLERLMGHVQVTTVLFYPGTLYGPTELRFMGVCEPSPNYRPTIFG